MLDEADDMEEMLLRLGEDLPVGVRMVKTARFSGDGIPFMVMARLKHLPNLM